MELNPVIIIGTGPEGRIALDIFNENGVLAYGFLTDDKEKVGSDLNDISVFGMLEDDDVQKVLQDSKVDYIVTYGEADRRRSNYLEAFALTKRPALNAISSLARLSPYAKPGFGNLLNAGTIINPNVMIGDHNIFHANVSVDPDTKIGSYCTFSAGSRIGGNCEIGDQVFIGTGAIIYPGVKIEDKCVIGAGSVVLKSLTEGTTVNGNPAMPV